MDNHDFSDAEKRILSCPRIVIVDGSSPSLSSATARLVLALAATTTSVDSFAEAHRMMPQPSWNNHSVFKSKTRSARRTKETKQKKRIVKASRKRNRS